MSSARASFLNGPIKMRITVLGCWAPYPRAGGNCSGYLLQDGGACILLDAGNGTFSHLRQFAYYGDISAAVITHLHPDHYVDLYCLRHAIETSRREGRRYRPVKLFLPAQPVAIFKEFTTYHEAFEVVPIESLPEEKIPPGVLVRRGEVGQVYLYFLPVPHSIPAYAIGVEGSGYFVYSGDMSPIEEMTALAEKASIFLCEASGLDKDKDTFHNIHMTARQAGEMAKAAQVKELILTHFYPEYNLELLRAQAEEGFGKKVELALEGHTYFVY